MSSLDLLQDQVLEAIKKATGLQNPETADPQTVKAEMQKPAANAQLEKDLQDIALEDLKERDRANEEAQRVEFERYRMDAEERERIRAEEFQRQLLDFQDRQVARSTQMQLAEEHSPLAWVAPILAFVLVGMIWYLLHAIMSAREQVINRDVFNVVLGALVTAFTTVMAYYFGSSLGSSRKDDALHSGRLVTNPKMKEQDGGDPGDDEASAPTSAAVSRVRKEFRTGYRDDAQPVPSGIYGLFRQKAPGIMRDLVRDLGLSEVQAAGILGNIGWECGGFKALQELNPVMGGRGGLGWCQWTASRRTPFEKWLRENGCNYQNDAANYGFLSERTAWFASGRVRAVRQTPNVENATRSSCASSSGLRRALRLSMTGLVSRGLRFKNTGGRSMLNESHHKHASSRYFMAPLWIALALCGVASPFFLAVTSSPTNGRRQDKDTLTPYKPGGLFAGPGASEPTATARGDGAGGAPGTGETSPLKPASVSDLVWKSPASALERAAEGVKHDRIEFAIYRRLLRAALAEQDASAPHGVSQHSRCAAVRRRFRRRPQGRSQRHGATGRHHHDDDQAGVAAGDALEKELRNVGMTVVTREKMRSSADRREQGLLL